MDLQCMGMCSEAVYGPAVYGQYMDLLCMGMGSESIYGPAVNGYGLRGSMWTCNVWVCTKGQYMDLQCMGMN